MILPSSASVTDLVDFASSTEIDNQVSENVDYFLRLRDKRLMHSYEYFSSSSQTMSSLLLLITALSLISIAFMAVLGMSLAYSTNHVSHIVSGVIVVVTNVFLWFFYYRLQRQVNSNGQAKSLSDSCRRHIRRILMVASMILECLCCYYMISKTVNGECNSDKLYKNWNCNPLATANAIPFEMSILVMFCPLIYCVGVRGSGFSFTMLLWVIGMATLIFSIVYSNAMESILGLITYAVFSLFVLIESKKENYFLFFSHLKLQETLRVREKAADEANAQEMRHMIANVAHDLKTPLASFLGGIEFISQITSELSQRQRTNTADCLSSSEMMDAISSITSCITSMRNTNSFMLMTINRCIDYTKASKGLKLVPKHETIDLMETLSLPLNCMKDIQQRVPIVLEPLSRDICSHVITDKQWLQENVLCLLSNAVKYSNDGTVTVAVKRIGCSSNSTLTANSLFNASPATSSRGDASAGSLPCPSKGCASSNRRGDSSGSIASRSNRYSNAPPDDPQDKEPEYLRFEVEDHGIGLSEEAIATLFSPFKQAQRLAGGTGLGLFSLSKRIDALNGECGVEKRRDGGEGSLFWFQIPYRADIQVSKMSLTPLARSRASSLSKMSVAAKAIFSNHNGNIHSMGELMDFDATAPLSVPSSPGRANEFVLESSSIRMPVLNILLVDDSPAILKMTSMTLRRHKHHVTTATNGAEAVKRVIERVKSVGKAFDVVLMDLQMPVMDGLEATRRLRAMESSGSWGSGKLSSPLQAIVRTVSRMSFLQPIPSRYRGSFDEKTEQPSLAVHRRSSLAEILSSVYNVIIGVSANSDVDTANEAYKMGVDGFMAKPFSLDMFYRTYDEILETRGEPLLHSTISHSGR